MSVDVHDDLAGIDTTDVQAYITRVLLRRKRAQADLDALIAERDLLMREVDEWCKPGIAKAQMAVAMLDDALDERMRAHVAEGGLPVVQTPWATVRLSTKEDWPAAWGRVRAKDAREALCGVLESIDAATFVRSKTERHPNADAVKAACTVLDDGRVVIDGELLPGLTVERVTRVSLTDPKDPQEESF